MHGVYGMVAVEANKYGKGTGNRKYLLHAENTGGRANQSGVHDRERDLRAIALSQLYIVRSNRSTKNKIKQRKLNHNADKEQRIKYGGAAMEHKEQTQTGIQKTREEKEKLITEALKDMENISDMMIDILYGMLCK